MTERLGPYGSLPGLVAAVRAGRVRAVARAISLVESGNPDTTAALARLLAPGSGTAHLVGFTGPPGVGKSTVVSAAVAQWRAAGSTVGVLAVDPSSPFTGGALLGDRIRMQAHAGDERVLIRSMATRGHLGGLASAAPLALRVLEAAGCELVCVETVGVGQSEIEVAQVCDTACVLAAPGAGDQVQAAKAGLLEVGDIFVVNKAERDGAQAVVRDLRSMVALAGHGVGDWKPPIVSTRWTAGSWAGIEELTEQIAAHRRWGRDTGAWHRRRVARARAEIEALVVAAVRRRHGDVADPGLLAELAEEVAVGRSDAHTAAAELLREWP